MTSATAPEPDSGAIYDAMRESATRLISAYYSQANDHPVDRDTMEAMRAVRAEALAIPANDTTAQLKATESFDQRREQIILGSKPRPDAIIPVLINGKAYNTIVTADGSQRFAPHGTIETVDPELMSRELRNSIRKRVIAGELPLEEYINLLYARQFTVGRLVDELGGLIYCNPNAFAGTYAELVDLQNPLWMD